MKRLRQIFFIVFLTFYQICGAQNSIVDSLKLVMANYKEDTLKVNILISICRNEYRSLPDSAISHGNTALNLSEKLHFGKGIANSYKYIGMGYYFQSNYAETIIFWEKSLSSFEAINDKVGVSNILSNLGAMYADKGDDVKALEYHIRSLKVAEESKDTLRIMTSLINIGVIYLNNPKTNDVALKYNLSALPLTEKLGDNDAIGTVSVNLGEIYFRKEAYDTALYYYEKSLNAFEKSHTGNVPYTLMNIGKVYMKRGDFKKAIEYQQKGYEIAKQSNAKPEMTTTLLGLAEVYSEEGTINSAIKTYNKALELAEETGGKKELKQAYEGLAKSYAKISDYVNAFKFQTLLTSIKDTLYIAANDKKIQTIQFNYELDKRETQISLLTKDKQLQEAVIKKQKLTQITVIIGLLIAILVSLQTYRNYRRKVRTNELLSKQKNEIEEQNKNLTTSINYAEKIQSAMFPSHCILSADLFEYFILFKPLDIVSGDFYWFRNTKDSVYVAAGDCTGHGVPAAFMSILGLTFLNDLVNQTTTLKTNEILTRLRDHVIRTLHQKHTNKNTRDGMEMALFILDLKRNSLQFSGARRPLYMIRDNQLTELSGDKIPLGIYDDHESSFTNQEIEFKKNDMVYVFSDGFVDQLGGPERKTFKSKKFKETLLNNCHLPMPEQKVVLETALEEWKSGIEQIDDILVIGIKFKCGAVDEKVSVLDISSSSGTFDVAL
jgi:serine phosphatase RsbU (regulator of sigma subunit)/Tfp pilus assembly protein PilF